YFLKFLATYKNFHKKNQKEIFIFEYKASSILEVLGVKLSSYFKFKIFLDQNFKVYLEKILFI
ncbi:MAG: hypothetical protein ACKO96_11860, partial [Flammeovirgaceae bacterium]